MKINVKLFCFGALRIGIGKKDINLKVDKGVSLQEVLNIVIEIYGNKAKNALLNNKGDYMVSFIINGISVQKSFILNKNNVEIKLLPPVSGG